MKQIIDLKSYLKPKTKEDIIKDLSKLSQDELDETLINACINGETHTIQYLIDADVNVNVKNKWGQTALILVSSYGHKDIVKILIDNGADVNVKNKYGWTPLMFASANGCKDIVDLLKQF